MTSQLGNELYCIKQFIGSTVNSVDVDGGAA